MSVGCGETFVTQFKREVYDKVVASSLCGTNRSWYDMGLAWALSRGFDFNNSVRMAASIADQTNQWK